MRKPLWGWECCKKNPLHPTAKKHTHSLAAACRLWYDSPEMQTQKKTFVFDSTAMRHLRSLSSVWGVSQTETVRRALSKTALSEKVDTVADDPVAVLVAYHKIGGLDRVKAEAYLRQVREDRRNWRKHQK